MRRFSADVTPRLSHLSVSPLVEKYRQGQPVKRVRIPTGRNVRQLVRFQDTDYEYRIRNSTFTITVMPYTVAMCNAV